MITFSDGMKFDTSGPLRPVHRSDGWYVVGNGMLLPVADFAEANATIREMCVRASAATTLCAVCSDIFLARDCIALPGCAYVCPECAKEGA